MRYERTLVLPATPEEVRAALTEREELGRWFDADVEIDARVGGRVTMRGADGDTRLGTVEAAETPRELVFRWWAPGPAMTRSGTRVTFTITALDDGSCELTVAEETIGPARASAPPYASATRAH